ncbi:MAG: hypothetical protein OEM98_14955 [Gammaproteobacteria bacterium]|nr:hypothetical protein [Gammaproteobacteria bacterium]
MMRWNLVIGGQEISKTGMGLLSYQMQYFGRQGLLIAALVRLGPLAALFGLTRFSPPWEAEAAS